MFAFSIARGRSPCARSPRSWVLSRRTSGDDDAPIHDIAPLESAGPDEISVFSDLRYVGALLPSRARSILISRDLARHADDRSRLMVVKNARLAYALSGVLSRAGTRGRDRSRRARTSERVHRSGGADRGGAVIAAGAEIGAGCHISYNAVIGEGVRLGEDCRIGANTSISHALIGNRVGIETGVTIGSQGFGFVPGTKGLLRMLQLGRVLIEDVVQIGANCAIDRGATGDTVIGAGTVLDNLVQIAHNVRLGRHCVICAQVGIAGSTVVGDGVMMGGQVGVADHLSVGAGTHIAGKSGVIRNVDASAVVGGFPAVAIKDWHRQTVGLAQLSKKPS